MAKALKLIIPLLNENFKLTDFNETTHFVEGYLEDINRPSLVNHIFLMYDGDMTTYEEFERDQRFRSFKSLYSRKTIYVNKKPYLLYTFVNILPEIRRIKEGKLPYKTPELKKIMSFWTLNDDFIFELACNRNIQFKTEGLMVPEEDYRPSDDDELDIYRFVA